MHVDVAGADVERRTGVLGLQQQCGCHEAVVGHVGVQPAGQVIAAGLHVLEDRVDVTGDPDAGPDVAVGAQALEPAVRAGGVLTQLGSASGAFQVVDLSQRQGQEVRCIGGRARRCRRQGQGCR